MTETEKNSHFVERSHGIGTNTLDVKAATSGSDQSFKRVAEVLQGTFAADPRVWSRAVAADVHTPKIGASSHLLSFDYPFRFRRHLRFVSRNRTSTAPPSASISYLPDDLCRELNGRESPMLKKQRSLLCAS
jgi:hypothetical protein